MGVGAVQRYTLCPPLTLVRREVDETPVAALTPLLARAS